MITNTINDFRIKNGKAPFYHWNPVENNHCEAHCWAMQRVGGLYHTSNIFLHDKAEAIAVCQWDEDLSTTISKIIWNIFGNSPGHKNVLLMDNLSYGIAIFNYQVYMTIRGW